MNKIYICTDESMGMNLLISGTNEEELNNKIDEIIEKLKDDPAVLVVGDTYIMGVLTATYLKLQYNIECTTQVIE